MLLSTAHASYDIDPKTQKPIAILDYNEHKGGVDTFDQLLRGYTTNRKSNRWPMVLFYNMLDVGAFAAFRLYELCHPAWNANKSEKRKTFLKEFAFELAKNHMESRCKTPLPSVKIAMDLIGFRIPNMTTASLAVPTIKVMNRFHIY